MKTYTTAVLLLILMVFPEVAFSRRVHVNHSRNRKSYFRMERPTVTKGKGSGPETVEVAGSSLPDCSHACGSCSPCRLVMVSFVCAAREEAETCPMAYKCMCKNKSFPVP